MCIRPESLVTTTAATEIRAIASLVLLSGAAAFFRGFYDVDLVPGELIVAVQFTPVKSAAYAKLHQRASHYAIVGVAVALDVKGGVIQAARAGLTGASTHAMRLTGVEQALSGTKADGVAAAVARAADDAGDLNADLHASADYRKAMIPVFVRRAVERALARA